MLKIEIKNKIATLIIDRPAVHNAINAAMMTLLENAQKEIANSDVRVIVLSGAGEKTFCAGGDIRYFATLNTSEACREMSLRMQKILDGFYRGKIPVIAAVNGSAFGGGCEILSACHIRIAADHAIFSYRQVPNGIITGWGGGRRLFRQIGQGQALRLLLSGETIDANTARAIGLIESVSSSAQLMSETMAIAEKIAAQPPDAVAAFLTLAAAMTETDPVGTIADLETSLFEKLWMGDHFRDFLQRFLNKF